MSETKEINCIKHGVKYGYCEECVFPTIPDTKGVEDGMGDLCKCGHSRNWHSLSSTSWIPSSMGCLAPGGKCECSQFTAAVPVSIPSAPATPEEPPTFAYSLAMYLTRNGQQGNAPELQAGIEQFMRDKGSVTTRLVDRIEKAVAAIAEMKSKNRFVTDEDIAIVFYGKWQDAIAKPSESATPEVKGKASPISADHPESKCQLCGGPNYHWHVDSAEWNAAMRCGDEPDVACIVCPNCFMEQSCKRGLDWQWHIEADKSITPYTDKVESHRRADVDKPNFGGGE